MTLLIAFCAGAYVAGSVNVSIVLFQLLGKPDPRSRFSRNAGATNVRRQAGLSWAAVVLFLDMARAAAVAWASLAFIRDPSLIPWIGLALILGNRFPCFHGFKGGKGVANYLGFVLALNPAAALLSGAAWGMAHRASKIPFVASFAMTLILTLGMMARFQWDSRAMAGTAATAVLIFFFHKPNIEELIRKRGVFK
ncbi:Glycerol-3-phosphate acyltransferase [Candidatus Desulfarcum epimagneticum]|uniref:Glycerol-3-phosphate acyltransferase n=1 Tax=uncultured Desulfobacteraceae bacterium TaxID=218296 RepID=A0A484HP98_9BACT|nr:Glycerol-3-phosphate acyltransferase [uncultured Desulfobacteraceae bacterium]